MTTFGLTTDTMFQPGAPAVPGLIFRGFQGESDYPLMAAVIEASKVADQIERVTTAEDVARNYSHMTNSDPYKDMIFAEVHGEVVGYGRCEWHQNTAGERLYFHLGFVKPAWRRKGIGRGMLGAMQRRLCEIAATQPGDGPRFFEAFAADTEAATEALLRCAEYSPVRHFYQMVRPLSEAVSVSPLPPGLEVRPASPEHRRAIWEADQEAFRDHWGYVPGTEVDYQRWLDDPIQDPALWQIAWDAQADQVAGMVLNFLNRAENIEYKRERGWTEGLSVRRPWRKRGVARALLTRSLQMFKDMGMTEAALGVDTENVTGALRLYESVGFRVVKRSSAYRRPLVADR